jgi:hypothetical protein
MLAIVVGSRRLAHFDAALVGYTFATLFAAFGVSYRYAMWLQRPPTRLYWRRGWQVFFRPRFLVTNVLVLARRVSSDFIANRFIWRRGKARWAAHWFIMWGGLLAIAITFLWCLVGFTLKQSKETSTGTVRTFLDSRHFAFPSTRHRKPR